MILTHDNGHGVVVMNKYDYKVKYLFLLTNVFGGRSSNNVKKFESGVNRSLLKLFTMESMNKEDNHMLHFTGSEPRIYVEYLKILSLIIHYEQYYRCEVHLHMSWPNN